MVVREVKPNVAPRRAARREIPARDLAPDGRREGSIEGRVGGGCPGRGTAELAWPFAWEVEGDQGVRWVGRLSGQEVGGVGMGVGVRSSIEGIYSSVFGIIVSPRKGME